MWKYNLKNNCVEEIEILLYTNGEEIHKPIRSIPVSGKVEWIDGQEVVKGKDFEIDYTSSLGSDLPFPDLEVAVPIQPKEHKSDITDKEEVAKDFINFLSNDAIPTTKNVLEELKRINAENDAAKSDIEQEAGKRYSAKMFIGETGTKFDNLTLDQVDYLISADNAIRAQFLTSNRDGVEAIELQNLKNKIAAYKEYLKYVVIDDNMRDRDYQFFCIARNKMHDLNNF